jgi:hypothetical protein
LGAGHRLGPAWDTMEESGGVDSGSSGPVRQALAPGTPVNGCSSAHLLASTDEARHGAAARTGGGRTARSAQAGWRAQLGCGHGGGVSREKKMGKVVECSD